MRIQEHDEPCRIDRLDRPVTIADRTADLFGLAPGYAALGSKSLR